MTKQILLDVIDFIRHQVADDKCTAEEIRSIYKSIVNNLDIDATAKDVSQFYGVSEQSVRNLTQYTGVRKPKRKVYYNFINILKHKPAKWQNN